MLHWDERAIMLGRNENIWIWNEKMWIIKVFWLHSTIGQVLPATPCPSIFQYKLTDNPFQTNDMFIKGVITVVSSLPALLKVKLQVPMALTTEYHGRLEVGERVQILESPHLERIKYNLYFPKNLPLPQIILIEVNKETLCLNNPVHRLIKTIVVFNHSLRPSSSGFDASEDHNHIIDNAYIRDRFYFETNSPESLRRTCGKSSKKTPFKIDGTPARRGDWPWMVPLFKKIDMGMQFICASTLITDRFVLTAAHCLKGPASTVIDKNDLLAYPGKFNISNWVEDGTQPREISDIHVHPDYVVETLYSDLALVKFKETVRISPFVNPACVWDENNDLSFVVGKKGIVTGWGMDDTGHKFTSTPNVAATPIVSQEECLRSRMEFLFLTSNRTLCAGFRDGTGPCSGDSGGGLFLMNKDKNGDVRWFLHGIISLSLMQEGKSPIKCNLYEFTVYTDVAKFRSWLWKIIWNTS